MNQEPQRRLPPASAFFRALGNIVAGKGESDKDIAAAAVSMASSHPRRPYFNFNNRSGMFKPNRRKALKLSARRRQRRIGR
jgi:hypothetical protein